MFFKKATKIDEIFTVDLTVTTYCQIDGEDFVNFWGLFWKRELYEQMHVRTKCLFVQNVCLNKMFVYKKCFSKQNVCLSRQNVLSGMIWTHKWQTKGPETIYPRFWAKYVILCKRSHKRTNHYTQILHLGFSKVLTMNAQFS